MKELAYRSKFSVSNPCFEVRHLERSVRANRPLVVYAKCACAYDVFAVLKDIPVTCTLCKVPSPLLACACMKGAGFKISRLAIDKVQLTVKHTVARCGTSLYKAIWNFRFWSYFWPKFYLDPLIDACQCAWSFDFTLIAVADESAGRFAVISSCLCWWLRLHNCMQETALRILHIASALLNIDAFAWTNNQ